MELATTLRYAADPRRAAEDVAAPAGAGLDAVSGGRALLGLGASGPQVIEGWHGRPYDKPLCRTRETVRLCRRIWRREVIDHHSITDMPLPPEEGGRLGKPLKILTRPVRPENPVCVAALGPATVWLTAEIADGWLPTLCIPEGQGGVGRPAGRAGHTAGPGAQPAADRGRRVAGHRRGRRRGQGSHPTMRNVHPVEPEPAKLIETVKNWL